MIASPFSGWARMVQASCLFAGLGDPLQGREVLRARVAEDDPRRVLAPFVVQWWAMFRDAWKRPSDLLAPLTGDATESTRDYRAALHEISSTPSPAVLGKLLASCDDAAFEVYSSSGATIRVQLGRKAQNGSKWFVLRQVS